jgi:REP-associated tyrosine transposase
MPRCARTIVPGVALHVIQRGNNRGVCFFGDGDRLAYLRYLHEFTLKAGCLVHAYCLMTNHVHLLLTPHEPSACALLMKSLNQHYVQHVNRVHGRTGNLWEGRYRSCLAASERYVLACYRYVELNPVRAGMVARPGEYVWSSYRCNAQGRPDSLLVPHPAFLALGEGHTHCRHAYRSLVERTLDPLLMEEIRSATRSGRALGVEARDRGRPAKNGVRPYFSST